MKCVAALDLVAVLVPVHQITKRFVVYQGELQLVLDLVVKLEQQQQEVSIPNVPDTRTHAGRLGSMAREAALRCSARWSDIISII